LQLPRLGAACPEEVQATEQRWDLKRFTVTKRLASTPLGDCFEAVDTFSGLKCAVKSFRKLKLNTRQVQIVRREVEVLSRLTHPHIVPLWVAFEDISSIYMVFELCAVAEAAVMDACQDDEKTALREVIVPLASALAYCHANRVLHRNVSVKSLLLRPGGEVCLGGWEAVIDAALERPVSANIGRVNYRAPEVFLNEQGGEVELREEVPVEFRRAYNSTIDTWSLGVLLAYLVGHVMPFENDSVSVADQSATKPKLASTLTPYARELVTDCLCQDPTARLTMEGLLGHFAVEQSVPADELGRYREMARGNVPRASRVPVTMGVISVHVGEPPARPSDPGASPGRPAKPWYQDAPVDSPIMGTALGKLVRLGEFNYAPLAHTAGETGAGSIGARAASMTAAGRPSPSPRGGGGGAAELPPLRTPRGGAGGGSAGGGSAGGGARREGEAGAGPSPGGASPCPSARRERSGSYSTGGLAPEGPPGGRAPPAPGLSDSLARASLTSLGGSERSASHRRGRDGSVDRHGGEWLGRDAGTVGAPFHLVERLRSGTLGQPSSRRPSLMSGPTTTARASPGPRSQGSGPKRAPTVSRSRADSSLRHTNGG